MAGSCLTETSLLPSFSWQILRYARFLVSEDDSRSGLTLTSTTRTEQKWKYVSPAPKDGLRLVITNGHMMLTNGDVILENYFLPDMRSTMRGFIRGDSLLFVIKIKNEARKFRVRFARGPHPRAELTCEDCASKLSYYFPVKPFEPPQVLRPIRPEPTNQKEEKEVISGEETVKDVTRAILTDGNKELPLPYRAPVGLMDSEDLNQMLRLFLSEASFPSFVGAVETELGSIIDAEGGE